MIPSGVKVFLASHPVDFRSERPAKAFSLGRGADIIGRVSSRLP